MKWKQILKFSLLAITLAACEVQNQITPEEKQPVIYEVNEQIMAPSDDGQEKEVLVKDSNKEVVNFLWASDGDSVVFSRLNDDTDANAEEQVKVRFLLIDCAEMKDKETGKPQPFAEEAKARTTELLESAKEIMIETDVGDQYDKYNRLLAYVYVDGLSVQEILLNEGLAKVAYIIPPNTRYLEEFRKAEAIGVQKGVGLWQ